MANMTFPQPYAGQFEKRMAAGKLTSGTLTASGNTVFSISFGKELPAVPVVVACIPERRADFVVYINSIQNVTATGFEVQIRNNHTEALSLDSNRYVSWIAICL